jgi:HAD superfamily hydrolase (TIGR01509 family)
VRTPIDLIIFDCDGVLVDSEPISNGVLAAMLAEQGLALDVAEARRRFQGLTLAEVQRDAESAVGRTLPAGWLDEFIARRAVEFDRGLRAVPGASAAVTAVLAAGLAVCVASQGSLRKTARSLALTGLEGFFPAGARFSAEQVARGKPAPDLFLHAARCMGAAPARCLVVEDTPSGVSAAVSAGMSVLGFAADADADALAAAGAETFEELAELPDLLPGRPAKVSEA